MAQITQNGYIARPDGERDWYLRPEKFGISSFFEEAKAIIDFRDGECHASCAEYSGFTGTLQQFIDRMNESDGYIAIEANPQNLSYVDELIKARSVTEIHCINVPVNLNAGIYWSTFFETKPQLEIVERRIFQDNIVYDVYRFSSGTV